CGRGSQTCGRCSRVSNIPRNCSSRSGSGSIPIAGSPDRRRSSRPATRHDIRRRRKRPCAPCWKASPTQCCEMRLTTNGNTWTSISIPSRCFAADVFGNEPAMRVTTFSLPPLPLSRRDVLIGSAAGLLLPSRAGAQTKLVIPEGNVAPLPIAIPNFLAGTPADGEVGAGLTGVITNNLKRSGLFAPIDQAAFIEKITDSDKPPQFQNWKTINAQALVTGRATRQPDGRLKAEFRLWDVASAQQLTGQQYVTSPEFWRRIAHIISDQIYERLTGDKGYFDSRVVFVDETGAKERRVKRLALMDQDGANVRYLTRGADLVLTPRFSPSTQEITYMEFGQGDPRVYLFNIETGQREIVGNFPGMSFAPRFSPDG